MQNFIETVPKKRELDEVLDWLKCERDCDKRGYGIQKYKMIGCYTQSYSHAIAIGICAGAEMVQ